MKRKIVLTVLLLGILSIISCKNQSEDGSVMKLLDENPSSINWNPESSMPEIQDMIPNSKFINDYVSKTTAKQVKVRDTSKDMPFIEIRYKVVAKIFGVEIKIPYFVNNIKEGYSYRTQYSYESYGSNKVPYLYVVGLDNNTFKLLEQQTEGAVTEQQIRDVTNKMKAFMEAGKALNIAQNVVLIGLFNGGIERVNKCQKAVDWFNNIDGEIGNILGSTENDGLVAKESQFYASSWHSNIIDPYDKGYVPEDNETHFSIDPRKNTQVTEHMNTQINKYLTK